MSRIVHADETNFESEVVQSDRPVLVDFSATWCGPCKQLEPLVEQIAGEYDGRLKVVKVDVDRAPALAARFAVLAVPTLLIMRNGEVKDQLTGLVPRRTITERVDRVL
jgi:thioredoxin 1